MGGKVGVSPGLDDNLPMARRWIWSFKLEHLPGDGHLPLCPKMLTVKDQGLASADINAVGYLVTGLRGRDGTRVSVGHQIMYNVAIPEYASEMIKQKSEIRQKGPL